MKARKRVKGWSRYSCHCCGGIQWGGEYPRECPSCDGKGFFWLHRQSRRLAQWPGGPFLGCLPRKGLR